MIYGTVAAYGGCTACTTRPFGNSLALVPGLGDAGLHRHHRAGAQRRRRRRAHRVLNARPGVATAPTSPSQSDYFADVGDPGVEPVLDTDPTPIH